MYSHLIPPLGKFLPETSYNSEDLEVLLDVVQDP